MNPLKNSDNYFTPAEAANSLGVDENVIWRRLECGELTAIILGRCGTKEGLPLGYDYALLSPEGVRCLLSHDGNDVEIKFNYARGMGQAIATARKDRIRVLRTSEFEGSQRTSANNALAVTTEDASNIQKRKRPTWRTVAWGYVVGVYKAGQYATTKDLYKALLGKAGIDDSPFQRGIEAHKGSLFVHAINKPLALKTLENAILEIRQAAK